jgi:membrane protein YqaA with SNARE-associated domain
VNDGETPQRACIAGLRFGCSVPICPDTDALIMPAGIHYPKVPMTPLAAYATLFVSAFSSATLLPGSSEAVLLGLLVAGIGDPTTLVLVALAGNLLGSMLSYIMGRYAAQFRDRRWFPVSPAQFAKAEAWYAKYGWWSLFFAWVPLVGDPLTVVAGAMRTRIALVIVLVGLGKFGRYVFVAGSYTFLAT